MNLRLQGLSLNFSFRSPCNSFNTQSNPHNPIFNKFVQHFSINPNKKRFKYLLHTLDKYSRSKHISLHFFIKQSSCVAHMYDLYTWNYHFFETLFMYHVIIRIWPNFFMSIIKGRRKKMMMKKKSLISAFLIFFFLCRLLSHILNLLILLSQFMYRTIETWCYTAFLTF